MTDTNIRHEVEVDTRIAAAYGAWVDEAQAVARFDREIERLAQRAEQNPTHLSLRSTLVEWETRRDAMVEKRDAARAAYVEVSKEYAGWSRFFLVRSSNGHIHSSMQCSTCFIDTDFGWLVDCSGLTEAEAVAAHGERLCTVCFPSAPSAWTDGKAYYARIARETRDARTAEREAKKAAKEAKEAARREVEHYGMVYVRHADGARIEHFRDYRGEIDWSRSGSKSIKAARKEKAEYAGSEHGHMEIVDLHTMEVVE